MNHNSVKPRNKVPKTGRIQVPIATARNQKLVYGFHNFSRFTRPEKAAVLFAYKAIRQTIMQGKPITEINLSSKGITVTPDATGSYRGASNLGTFRVNFGDKQFFVKLERSRDARRINAGQKNLENFLTKCKTRLGSFRVCAVPIISVFDVRASDNVVQHAVRVTPFYNKDEVTMVADLDPRLRARIVAQVITPLTHALQQQMLVIGPWDAENSFYQKRTNTVLLFDTSSVYQQPQPIAYWGAVPKWKRNLRRKSKTKAIEEDEVDWW